MTETDPVAALIRDVAERIILPRFRNLATDQIIEKAPGDLVTIADREATSAPSAGPRRMPNSSTGRPCAASTTRAASPGVNDVVATTWATRTGSGTG